VDLACVTLETFRSSDEANPATSDTAHRPAIERNFKGIKEESVDSDVVSRHS